MLVLHHVPEPERALAEVARVLKPGGRASSSTCCRTIATATASRWGTSGSGSATSTFAGCSRNQGSKRHESSHFLRTHAPRVRDYSSQQAGKIMATVDEKMHPYDAAKAAGREPFKVRNLAEAEFGRKEMRSPSRRCPA
jgi:Methylase involved in ubiquinone/menaquinone biosynthesis